MYFKNEILTLQNPGMMAQVNTRAASLQEQDVPGSCYLVLAPQRFVGVANIIAGKCGEIWGAETASRERKSRNKYFLLNLTSFLYLLNGISCGTRYLWHTKSC